MKMIERVIAVVSGLMLVYPGTFTDIVGIGVLIVLIVIQIH